MIYIRSKGRLGNQLFIYAFARALADRTGQNILLYDRKNEKDSHWHSHLDKYNLCSKIKFTSCKKDVLPKSLMGRARYYWDRFCIRNKDNRTAHNVQLSYMDNNLKHGLFLLQDGFYNLTKEELPTDLFCDGYFQSEQYFHNIRKALLKELTPTDIYSNREREFVRLISSCNSVCVTIRLGDYINNEVHQVCTKEYYIAAMDRMKKLQPDCMFFIFSDEPDKAKKVFRFPYPVIYEEVNPKSSDVVGLDIMARCNHFIISNSSYSWWAQYLGTYRDKIVISPSKWYAADVPTDIMQESWIKMEC